MMGPLARRTLAALAGCVAALVVLEVGLRIAVAPSASQVLRGLHRATPDRPWLYEMVPGESRRDALQPDVVYATNAAGFRDREVSRDKAPGTFRIAVVGDSVAFGYGVALEDTFAKRLEIGLGDAASATRWEVLSFGVSGYNPYNEAELLRGVVLGHAPDLVLVQFCVNDLNDPTLHFDASTVLALAEIPDAAFPDPSARVAAEPAPVAAFALRACSVSRLCALVLDTIRGQDADLVAALAPHDVPSPREVEWLERLYARMASDARAAGARLAVVAFPYATQTAPDAPATLQGALAAVGRAAGVPVIDLLPAFRRAASASAEPLFLDLWHPTRRGHAVAAEALLGALACDDLVPGIASTCGDRDARAPSHSPRE